VRPEADRSDWLAWSSKPREPRREPNARVKKVFSRNFREAAPRLVSAAAYEVSPWPRIREITQKSLHDDHTAQLAWRVRRL